MTEGSAVEIKAPSFENKININTIWITICVVGAIGTLIVNWATQAEKDRQQTEWQIQHIADHATRRTDRARLDAEIAAKNILQDAQLAEALAKVERLGDRVTTHDEAIKAVNSRVDRLADSLGDLRGLFQETNQKLAVVQTILERIENKQLSLNVPPQELSNRAAVKP